MSTTKPKNIKCPVLTLYNVKSELKKAGVRIYLRNGTSLASLDPGVFNAKTQYAKLDQNCKSEDIAVSLKNISQSSAGLLSLARVLIEDPSIFDNISLYIQNKEANPKGDFTYAFARRWNGGRILRVDRDGGRIAGNIFLVNPI